MKLRDLVQIDNRFEKSVNLLLDLFSQDKIDGYIPTRSSIKILGEYIHEVQTYTGNRASVLIGPYGKGKSHLLLVLLTILSQSCQISVLDKLISRIAAANEEVAEDIRQIISGQGVFLPVIINAGAGTLNQAFLKGLTNALYRDALTDVIPDNYYTKATHMIQHWKHHFPDTYKAFEKKLGKQTVKSFVKALDNFDEQALALFQKIYPELTSGSVFNPVVENEVISVYRSVNRILREKHGYSGIYIVFDEFSKYIEGHAIDGFAEDMKVLQDMCELCNASKEEQLHLTCVAHKSIKAYGNALPSEILNAFKGVEGRLKETYFVVSSQNNYELLSDAITKNPVFDTWAQRTPAYGSLIDETYTLKSFSALFTQTDYQQIVGKGCFPLTPVAAMLLLDLSEKIAQNERTIFTYLTSRDKNGLARYVEQSKTSNFVGVQYVYDYFIPLFQEDTQTGIHHEWLKADYALSQTEDEIEQAVIKALAVIRMVHKPDEIATTEQYIVLASGIDKQNIQDAILRLVHTNLIVFKNRTRCYEFKNNIGVDVEREITECIKKRFSKVEIGSVLGEILSEKYVLPKKHNQMYHMTRYFNFAYLTVPQFMSLKTTQYFEWMNRPDGVVVMLLPEPGIDQATIEAHTREINDSCLVVCLPRTEIDCVDKVKYLLAVQNLQRNTVFLEDNQVIKKELDTLEEDTINELNDWFLKTYFPLEKAYGAQGQLMVGTYGLNRLVSDICDVAYPDTPMINHELINRHEVTAQTAKARNTILNDLLNGRDTSKYETGTSAESTIFRATMLHTKSDRGLALVKQEIHRFISRAVAHKVCFEEIVSLLMRPPFGVRKGVMAIYMLDCLLHLDDMPIIYFNNKEVIVDVDTINNIIRKPSEYYLYVELETVQKNEYIHGLEVLFTDFDVYCREVDKRNQLAKISCMMQSWYRSLPQTSMTFTEPDYLNQEIKKLSAFRKLFADLYLNPREVLFERIPKIFQVENFQEALYQTKKAKEEIDAHIHFVKQVAVQVVREQFQFTADADLRQSLSAWYGALPEVAKNSIFSARAQNLLAMVQTVSTGDAEEIASKIVHETTGMFIEDWKTGISEKFRVELQEILDEIESKKEQTAQDTQKILLMGEDGTPIERFYTYTPDKLSVSATFFQRALDDVIEEYGDSIENNEIIGILMDTIKKRMN